VSVSGILIVLLFLVTSMTADIATQTDWSGGGGELGPVAYFGDNFWSENCIDWFNENEQISLGYSHNEIVDSIVIFSGIMAVGDFNGDFADDVACCCYTLDDSYSVYWFENNGSMYENWPMHSVSSVPVNGLVCSDMDNDGDMDIAAPVYLFDGFAFAWFENEDGIGDSWEMHVLPDPPQDYGIESDVVADLNGDDNSDYVITYIQNGHGYIDWWENNGPQSDSMFTERKAIREFDEKVREILPADIDDDGDLDLATSINWETFPGHTVSRILWLDNTDGSGTQWIDRVIRNDRYHASDILTCDFDKDGYIDVLESNLDSGIYIQRNTDGTGLTWEETWVGYSPSMGFEVADIDLDGDNDLIRIYSYYCLNLGWCENIDGQGYEWLDHGILRNLDNMIEGMSLIDFDNDCYQDLLIAVRNFPQDEQIILFELCFNEGYLESSVLDTGDTAAWGIISWLASIPDSTLIGFQVRASDSPTPSGVWSDTVFQSLDLTDIIGDGDRYIQYRVILQTSNPQLTPVLEEVSIEWNELIITGDDPEDAVPTLFRAYPNPASELITISYNLTEEGFPP